ncbi:MAG: hypothetical protein JW716_02960 [Candidatus Aenigmarchaeota archaeon]|nr:hypothetical protein [Candidatus Aenigmarchaeota archaeon]
MDFSSDLPNSTEIPLSYAPEFFFPNATEAVYYGDNETLGIFASLLSNYLDIPMISGSGNCSHIYNLSNMSFSEIRELFIQKVLEKKGSIDCLAIVNPDHESSLLAGRYAGKNGCWIVLTSGTDYDSVRAGIYAEVDYLMGRDLLSGSIGYKMGNPLYIVIFGGDDSVPFNDLKDFGHEIFFDHDGGSFYNDLSYGWRENSTMPDFIVGRFMGSNEDISLQIESDFLEKENSSVIYAEYAQPLYADVLSLGGGMLQGLVSGIHMEMNGIPVDRFVEQRIDGIPNSTDIDELKKDIRKYAEKIGKSDSKFQSLKNMGMTLLKVFDLLDVFLHTIMEYDWIKYVFEDVLTEEPEHLPVISEDAVGNISDYDIAAYYGPGVREWLLPNHNMSYWSMVLYPYTNPFSERISINSTDYSGFLYNSHDISSESGVTSDILRNGGSLVVSSGVVHPQYAAYASNAFFRALARGGTVGEAFYNSINMNAESFFWSSELMMGTLDPGSPIPLALSGNLYAKSKTETLLLGDPKARLTDERYYPLDEPEYFITPFCSFLSVSSIESGYEIIGDVAVFNNADAELLIREKPAIPLYVREFYLPEGSVINYISFSGNYSFHEGLKKQILYNDTHYSDYNSIVLACADSLGLSTEEEPSEAEKILFFDCIKNSIEPVIEYPYPDNSYWNDIHSLLDGRVLLRVYVPAMLFDNETWSKILENATISIDYETPLEMYIDSENFTIFDDVIVKATVMNEGNGLVEGVLFVGINDTLVQLNVSIGAGSSEVYEISFGKMPEGFYSAVAGLETENVDIGPRHSGLFVFGEPFFESSYEDEIIVDEGESGIFNITLFSLVDIDFGGISFEAEDIVSNPVISKGNISVSAELFGENEWSIIATVNVPDMQPAGLYEGYINVIKDDHIIYSMPVKVDVPLRCDAEINPQQLSVKGIPKYSEINFFALINTGNAEIENVLAGSESLGNIAPGGFINYGLETEIPYSAPGIYDYTFSFVFDCGFCSVEEIVIPIMLEVEPVVYWEIGGHWEFVIEKDPPEMSFLVNNSNESNAGINSLEVSVDGIEGLHVSSVMESLIEPDSHGILDVSLEFPEGIRKGVNEGSLIISGEKHFIPESIEIPLKIIAEGMDFSVSNSYLPDSVFNIMNKFVVPGRIQNIVAIGNDGPNRIKSFIYEETLPDGWIAGSFIKVFLGRNFSNRVLPFRLLQIIPASGGTVEIRIDDFRKLAGRYLSEGEYIIISYPLEAQRFAIPETLSDAYIRVQTAENVYSEQTETFEIPIKNIGSIFNPF